MKTIANWGNFPSVNARVHDFADEDRLRSILRTADTAIARGLGRCYGDASLNENIISTLRFNRFLEFDQSSGLLVCEAGVTFNDIVELFVPRGWFPPVTPGTRFITVGGAVASDVHGKNHHKDGSFCRHVVSMDVMLADGSVETCSREINEDLFYATCGGMGLTGMILRVSLRLRKIETAYLRQRVVRAPNLWILMDLFEKYAEMQYSVAWLDCLATGGKLGRGVLIMGEHADIGHLDNDRHKLKPLKIPRKRKVTIPFYFPSFALNRLTVKLFNEMYYQFHPTSKKYSIVDIDSFFYPLDTINNWNRIYGRKGFIQYQFVLPRENSRAGLEEVLEKISKRGSASFLSVLKLFGKQNDLISFPMEGYTLALDFPIRWGIFELLDELDSIVLSNGGRHYLTKDSRMKKSIFLKGYKTAEEFIRLRRKYDSNSKFASLQSARLEL